MFKLRRVQDERLPCYEVKQDGKDDVYAFLVLVAPQEPSPDYFELFTGAEMDQEFDDGFVEGRQNPQAASSPALTLVESPPDPAQV
jgi:hypothetical protein